MITKSYQCSIKVFMSCLFDNDYTQLGIGSKEELITIFEAIHLEYIDLSGSVQTREFDLVKTIHNLQNRSILFATAIQFQRMFALNFGMPYLSGFGYFNKLGYRIFWDKEHPDLDLFLKKLSEFELKEKRYSIELDTKVKELVNLKKNKAQAIKSEKAERKEFVKMLLYLQKYGFRVDKDKTNMEELALMAKEYSDYCNSLKKETKH